VGITSLLIAYFICNRGACISMSISRISGMASGMDTDTMVKKLMDAERAPLRKMQAQKQMSEWQRDDYRAMNSQLMKLRTSSMDMKLQGSFIGKSADEIVAKVKDFVSTYNDVLGVVNDKVSEEKFKGFEPLTEDQKADMSEKQVEAWEKKARSGNLKSDATLSGVLQTLRVDMYAPVSKVADTNYNQLTEIGISVKGSYQEKGKLTVDETKLRAAIAANPTAVMELFTSTGTKGQQGIASRMYDDVVGAMTQVAQKAGAVGGAPLSSIIGKQISGMDKQMSTIEKRMNEKENHYYQQFAAMEKALSKMNSQSAWLASTFK
jgi:flagellar hook-associated protein 2